MVHIQMPFSQPPRLSPQINRISSLWEALATGAFDHASTGNLCQLTTRYHRHAFAFPKQFNEVLLSRSSLEYRADHYHSCASRQSLM